AHLLQHSAAAGDTLAGLAGDLPIHVGLERSPGGIGALGWWATCAADGGYRQPGQLVRHELRGADGRRVHLDGAAVGDLLQPATLLRARHPGWLGEGLAGNPSPWPPPLQGEGEPEYGQMRDSMFAA